MDGLGVGQMNSKKQAKRSKKPIKVVYISTPMKVKTSASKFRDLVQELTGRDSDTTRYVVEGVNGADHQDHVCHLPDDQQWRHLDNEASGFSLSNSFCNLLEPYPELIPSIHPQNVFRM